MKKVQVGFGGPYEVGVSSRRGGKNARLIRQACDRIEELEIAVRAALSYIQNQPVSHGNGHAEMVIAALRGALRNGQKE